MGHVLGALVPHCPDLYASAFELHQTLEEKGGSTACLGGKESQRQASLLLTAFDLHD